MNRKAALLCIPLSLIASLSGQKRDAIGDQEPVANVEVIAFDTRGKFLGPANVKVFEDYHHRDFAAQFHSGVAGDIPFGEYRVEASLPAYSSAARYVRIYGQRTTVVVGLTVGYERPITPLALHGHVAGRLPSPRTFVKLSGIFSDLSMESSISPSGQFDIAGVTWGKYLLMVVGEDGILASRVLNIPYTGPPLEINLGTAQVQPTH